MLKESQLRNAAKEMNDVLGLEPPINTRCELSDLTALLRKAIQWIEPTDEFTPDTRLVIDTLTEPIAEETVEEAIVETPKVEAPVKEKRKMMPVSKDEVIKRFTPKNSTNAQRVAFLTEHIKTGKYKKDELVKMAAVEFPDLSLATLGTLITDGKNPKYNKFDKLIIQDGDGKLCFEK